MTRLVPEFFNGPISAACEIGRSATTGEHRWSDMIQQADVAISVPR